MARCNGEEDGPSLAGFSDSRLRPHITLYPFLGATIHARRRAQKSARKFARRRSCDRAFPPAKSAKSPRRGWRLPIIVPTSGLGSFVVDLFWPLDWINDENGFQSRSAVKRPQRKR